MPSSVDLTLVVLTILLPILYLYRNSLPFINAPKDAANKINGVAGKAVSTVLDEGDPRDWVAKMERNVSRYSEAGTVPSADFPSYHANRTSDAPCFTVLRPEPPRNTLFD